MIGGCHCGQIRYEVTGEIRDRVLCHCTLCRRTAGAPSVAWFTVALPGFRFLRGQPTNYRSSDVATRQFCGVCGTQLTFQHDDRRHEIDITTASLDDPDAAAPLVDIHTDTRLKSP